MKVALYTRVSSDKQDKDLSISAQLHMMRDYAARNGYEIVKEFVDEAKTGRTTDRSAFKEMIALCKCSPKHVDAILVYKLSRFARNREVSIVYKTKLRKNGIQVISITEPLDDTPTGRLLEGIIESLDEFYSDNLGEDVTRGMRESASRGFYLSAKPPYGYRKVKVLDGLKERTSLEIDDKQTTTVTSIFDDILGGKGLKEIAKELNRKGIEGPRGKGWGKTGLHFILTNDAYVGTLVWGQNSKQGLDPIRVESAWPSLIDQDTFDRVQAQFKDRAPAKVHPKRASSRFLLSGLAHCGHCGKALVGQDAKGGKFSYYVCGTLDKKGAGSCPARYLNSVKFERLIIDRIKQHILTPDHLIHLVELVNEEMDKSSRSYQQEIENSESNIISINRRLEKLYDAIETGNVDLKDLGPRIKELRARQEKLMARKAELQVFLSDRRIQLASPEIVAAYVNDLHKLLSESSLAERRAFIKSFVKDVSVKDGEVLVTYTIPLSNEGVSQEKMEVLSTVQYGGRYWT